METQGLEASASVGEPGSSYEDSPPNPKGEFKDKAWNRSASLHKRLLFPERVSCCEAPLRGSSRTPPCPWTSPDTWNLQGADMWTVWSSVWSWKNYWFVKKRTAMVEIKIKMQWNSENKKYNNSVYFYLFSRQTHQFLDHSRGWKPFTDIFCQYYYLKIQI